MSILFYNKINNIGNLLSLQFIISMSITLLLIQIFPFRHNYLEIYKNKYAICLFLILEIVLQAFIFITNQYFGLNNTTVNEINIIYIRLLHLIMTATLFISYLFNISFKDFNWGITFKNFLLILIIYIFYKGLNIISYNEVNILMFDKNNIKNFIFHLIYQCFYPGIFEETLYRGFLVSGLRGLGLNENKSNVIQAVIFGASHLNSWGTGFSVFLLHTAFQAIIGYMFGKLYFKTKSLTPCIILHGLFNI